MCPGRYSVCDAELVGRQISTDDRFTKRLNAHCPTKRQSILRPIGSIFGLLVIVLTVSIAYLILRRVFYPAFSISYGSTLGVWIEAVLQYGGYALMAVFCFRYLSRLKPTAFSIKYGPAGPHQPKLGIFRLNFAICMVLPNLVHFYPKFRISLPALCFDVVLLYLLSLHDLRQHRFLDEDIPRVLFLRPFSSFSDRALLNGLLNSLPTQSQVVFLVPEEERVQNWDPYSLGLAGLRFRHPSKSTPIFLSCSNNEWAACVKKLVNSSHLILADITMITPSLGIELALIKEANACSRTVLLRDRSIAYEAIGKPDAGTDEAWLAVCSFERKRNVARAAVAFWFVVAGLGSLWMHFFAPLKPPPWVNIVMTILIGTFALRYWSVVFLKRSVSRGFFRSIRGLLNRALSQQDLSKWPAIANSFLCIAYLAVIGPVLVRAYGSHIAAGQVVNVRCSPTLVNPKGMETEPLRYSVERLRTNAYWRVVPSKLVLVLQERQVRVAAARVHWYGDPGYGRSDGIKLEFKGKLRVLESIPRGEVVVLLLSLPELKAGPSNLSPPRLLTTIQPEPPLLSRDGEHYWAVQTWTVHENKKKAMKMGTFAALKSLLVLGGVPFVLVLGWRMLKS